MAETEQQAQDIVVKVLKGGKEVETFRFRDPPKQAAQIKQELEDVGHKGVLQDNMYTYTREDVLQHGAYTLKVSEAAAGQQRREIRIHGGSRVPFRQGPHTGQNLTRSPIVGSPYEGLSARRSTYHTPRRETCSAILDLVVQQGVVLIKAPPHSGKTALLQLLQQAAVSHPSFQSNRAYYASMDKVYEKGFDCLWQDATGVEWLELTASPRSTSDMDVDSADGTGLSLVLIDESQLLWDSDRSLSSGFWTTLKTVLRGGGHICIVMAAAYGSEVQGLVDGTPTPADLKGLQSVNPWPSTVDGPAMQLTDLEVKELRKSFLSYCNLTGADAEGIAPLLDYCSNLTKNQPGPFVILLDKIAQFNPAKFTGRMNELQDRMFEYVLTRGLYRTMRTLRSIQPYDKIMANQDALNVFRQILAQGQISADDVPSDLAKGLVRRGSLVEVEDELQIWLEFPSKLHAEYFRYQHHKATLARELLPAMTLCQLLELTIERMHPLQLQQSLNTDSQLNLYERHYQMEFYRALLEVLPDHWLSPDVGPILGCKGMLDFVLMPLRYGFELLREGRDLQAHQDRFTKGLYKMLLDKGYVKSYIVIDLRCSNSVPRTRQDDNLWHVSFSDDFLKATVRSADACYSNTLQLKQG